MKSRVMVMLLMCIPGWAVAQNEEQMQRMMEQARQAQICMEKIDHAKLQALAEKAKTVEAEIKRLCSAGKRDEAQHKGMAYGKEMSQSPVAMQMRRCSELMAGAMAGFGGIGHSGIPSVEEMENQHICDVY